MRFLNTISRIFPPPRYVTMPSVGVDISDTSLKYIKFVPTRKKGARLKLDSFGDIDIKDGVLERGSVLDKGPLVEALKEVKYKTDTDFFHVSLPEERAYLFETEIKKGTSFKEIKGILEFRLEENVPLSPSDAFFDYDIVNDDLDYSQLRVSVTAYARETIIAYYEACKEAGILPVSFQVEAQAIARSTLPFGDLGTYLIVDFGKTRTGVGIVQRGSLMYTSTIDIGGNELSVALRKQLGEKEESELTMIKNTQGLVQSVENGEVYEALISPVSAIASELGVRIQYWTTRDVKKLNQGFDGIILCGGSSNLKGLPGYLREILGVPVEHADVWQNAFSTDTHVPEIDKRHSFGYATAIGLALSDFYI